MVTISKVEYYHDAGGGDTPTTYTVTYDANGGTGTMTDSNSPYNAGATVTVLGNEFTRTDYEFDHWNTAADNSGDSYDEDDTFTINANTTLYAQWNENTTPSGDEQWVLTDLADLTASDVFVIVGNNGSNYAMSNNNGTANAPAAVAVTVTGNEITSTVAATIQWNISGDATNGYTFYPNGTTSTWLYCTNTNNGVRVGTNSNKTFGVEDGYLKNSATSRFVGVYSSQDWRCYSSHTGTNNNIANQTFAFYKKMTGGVVSPSISANNVEIAYDAEEGTINYTINNPVEGGSIVASTEAEWLMVDDEAQTDAEGSIDFLCAPNSNFYAHSATVTLTYTYGDSKATVTKEVTVTQAKDPNANGSTAEYPITVSEALEAIDEVETVSDIYVGGIVSAIVDEYSSTYHNITFDMIDEEGNEYFLRAYRCVGTDGVNASEVAVGDYVIVKGDLKLYTSSNSSIYELGQGCQLVSLIHPAVPSITLNSYSIEATAEETEGTLTVTYTEIETDLGASIYWFESDGVTAASEPEWMSVEINTELNVEYLIEENEGAARTAYFKVYGLDEELNDVYSDLVTVSQAAVPQQYTLEVTSISNAEIFVFDATDPDETNWVYLFEGVDEVQVLEGTQIALSVTAEEGYTLTSLMVNNEDHVNDIQGGLYTFTMPASNVTITATAEESVAPAGGDYVRITSLDQLTDGSKVIIAARHNATANSYYAMQNATSGKPEGTLFTSVTSGNDEAVASTITDDEDNYYWTVNVTENGYTFMNDRDQMIGYNSSTNFATDNNIEWTIESAVAGNNAMVPGYEGFVIKNGTTTTRAFAFNGSAFGAYATTNMNAAGYNFFLDFFVQTEAVEPETHTLTVDAYTNDNTKDGYNLIASPVNVDPATVAGMTTGDFDLYSFDESQADEWRNYEAVAFNLVPGKGYLYAKKATTENQTYSFELTGIPYNNKPIILSKSESGDFPGWNLVGNPFGETAVLSDNRDFYVMNSDGSDFIQGSGAIAPMQGIFVIAEHDREELQITVAGGTAIGPTEDSKLVLNLTKGRGIIDRAVVRFGEGRTLPKFMLNADNTKLYITEGNQDYAVVRSNNAGEMPVSFKAAENGNYTLSIEAENVEASYLHLIDNMTGIDVNLLATPSYSFEARTTDYANRFRLEFNTNGVEENNATANFAYFNGSSWTVNNMGEATLQVVDVMGRVLSTESISGNTEVNLNQAAGVYMLRLVNGNDVKVQKVVVK